jgi:hypothetical protein
MLATLETDGQAHNLRDLRDLRERSTGSNATSPRRAAGDIPGGMQGDYA